MAYLQPLSYQLSNFQPSSANKLIGPGGISLVDDDDCDSASFMLPSPSIKPSSPASIQTISTSNSIYNHTPIILKQDEADFLAASHLLKHAVVHESASLSTFTGSSCSGAPTGHTDLCPITPKKSTPTPPSEDLSVSDHGDSDTDEVYQCKAKSCKKTFKKASMLKAHTKTHATFRPYECDFCHNSFARNHDLKRHIRSVHGVGKSVATACKFCNKVFSRKDSCAFHMATSCTQRGNVAVVDV